MMRRVTLDHEGTRLVGELYGDFEREPGVLVMHSGLGLKRHEREAAARLASLGYAALAIDMFGCGKEPSVETAGSCFTALLARPEVLRSRAVAWFETFAALPEVDPDRIGAIGYCFGGLCVLELARSGVDVRAVSSFHGLLTTHAPAAAGAINGDVAAWCGGRDPYAPREHIDVFREEMAAAGVRSLITTFEHAQHSFTNTEAIALNRPGIAYDAIADRVSWAGTLALLEAALKQDTGNSPAFPS